MKGVLGLLLLLSLISCNRTTRATEGKRKLKLKIEVIPEDDSSYSINWIDTLGHSNSYTTLDRPIELWCLFKVDNDTVGYYKGLSSPRHFAYITTKDSIIQAEFMIEPNIFSQRMTEEILNKNSKIIMFNPVDINIKKDIRKKLEFVLTEK